MTVFQFVDDPAALSTLMARLQEEREVALDTEFMREQTYYPRLCLIQLATPASAWAIDPLALEDLTALSTLLADPAVCKVAHAARQDVEVLLTRCAELPLNLFDTQVAAALCGFSPQIGYGELVQRMLGVQLDKAHGRTDWARRPLSAEQLQYAAEDVHHLLPLRDALTDRLRALGRLSWFEGEMERLADPGLYRTEPQEAWQRLKGLDAKDERRMAVARALAQWREERAIRLNRPRGWILADDALCEIVRRLPADVREVEKLKLLPPAIARKAGAEFAAMVVDAAHLPSRESPERRREGIDPAQQEELRALTATVKAMAQELDLSPEVLATRRELVQLLHGRTDVHLLRGWRRAVIGEALLTRLSPHSAS